MKLKLITLAALSAPLFGAYQYYYTDSLTSIDVNKWSPKRGSVDVTTEGLSSTDSNGGSLISSLPVPLGSVNYEVAANHSWLRRGLRWRPSWRINPSP
jgi:hypothetical protein